MINKFFFILNGALASFHDLRSNSFKHKWVIKMLCKNGLHEYELADVISDQEVLLSCVYCQHIKRSLNND